MVVIEEGEGEEEEEGASKPVEPLTALLRGRRTR